MKSARYLMLNWGIATALCVCSISEASGKSYGKRSGNECEDFIRTIIINDELDLVGSRTEDLTDKVYQAILYCHRKSISAHFELKAGR